MSGQAEVGVYGVTATATSLAGGTTGAVPYQSAAGTTSFANPNSSLATFYLDGTRTDSYTPNGTSLLPYKTLAQLFAGMASVSGPYVIYSTPTSSAYTYTGDSSLPAYFATIYGNESQWTFTGNLTVNAGFEIYNLNTTASGSLTYAATSAIESERMGGTLTIAGGIFTSGYEHFFAMSILSNTLVTLNAGATPVFTNVVGTPHFISASGATATTVLTIINCQSLATGAYINVDMSNGGLAVINGFACTNNNTVANINLSGSSGASASVANFLRGVSAAWVACGSSYTYSSPDCLIALFTGSAIHLTGASIALSWTNQTGLTSSVASFTAFTAPATGLYRVTASAQVTTAGSAGTVSVNIGVITGNTANLTTGGAVSAATSTVYRTAAQTVSLFTTVASNTGGVYRLDYFVERIG